MKVPGDGSLPKTPQEAPTPNGDGPAEPPTPEPGTDHTETERVKNAVAGAG
jgi:hypothetical protein